MPGRLFLTTPMSVIEAEAGCDASGAHDVAPRLTIKPGEEVMTLAAGLRPRPMRWGMIPSGRVNARGRPVLEIIVNARSETVFSKSAYEGVGRCVVPADGWYEWTGFRGRKTAWRIGSADAGILWFAGICDAWIAPGGREVWQAAIVTCPPSEEVRPIHDRMGVLLAPDQLRAWIDGPKAQAAALLKSPQDVSLVIERADEVDWAAS